MKMAVLSGPPWQGGHRAFCGREFSKVSPRFYLPCPVFKRTVGRSHARTRQMNEKVDLKLHSRLTLLRQPRHDGTSRILLADRRPAKPGNPGRPAPPAWTQAAHRQTRWCGRQSSIAGSPSPRTSNRLKVSEKSAPLSPTRERGWG